jgi:hypothetical protein
MSEQETTTGCRSTQLRLSLVLPPTDCSDAETVQIDARVFLLLGPNLRDFSPEHPGSLSPPPTAPNTIEQAAGKEGVGSTSPRLVQHDEFPSPQLHFCYSLVLGATLSSPKLKLYILYICTTYIQSPFIFSVLTN